ncbi:hypothetical protein TIFTF001_000129 [Ficus carica]|uniref:Uncharacterized protein n=1 Tax=Ficus carica TaxID=3494 RepID=A0AA87Z1Q8_FICCA|nr:hypothetical protein TIFTF001_000129 [Ficus carica]
MVKKKKKAMDERTTRASITRALRNLHLRQLEPNSKPSLAMRRSRQRLCLCDGICEQRHSLSVNGALSLKNVAIAMGFLSKNALSLSLYISLSLNGVLIHLP